MQELTSYLRYALVFSLEITKDKYEYILHTIYIHQHPSSSLNPLLSSFLPHHLTLLSVYPANSFAS